MNYVRSAETWTVRLELPQLPGFPIIDAAPDEASAKQMLLDKFEAWMRHFGFVIDGNPGQNLA